MKTDCEEQAAPEPPVEDSPGKEQEETNEVHETVSETPGDAKSDEADQPAGGAVPEAATEAPKGDAQEEVKEPQEDEKKVLADDQKPEIVPSPVEDAPIPPEVC